MEDKTNQPEKIPTQKVRKITPLDLLKRDVKLYRADCMMSVGNDKKCRPCTAAFFESILGMIDRIALQEAIARDSEATDFVLNYEKEKDVAKKLIKKISEDGGASV